MRKLGNWTIRGSVLALALVSITACVAYEPAPRYAYYEGPGYYTYGYPHAYYGGGYYYRDHWR